MLWIALSDLENEVGGCFTEDDNAESYLSNERHQLSEMLSLLIWISLEDLANAVIVVPLLKKFFLVRDRVAFDQVLQLRQI